MLNIANFVCLLVIGSHLFNENCVNVDCVRVKLNPKEEPSASEIHNIYRVTMADPVLFHVQFAGLLKETDIDVDWIEGNITTNKKELFNFNSGEFMNYASDLGYYINLQERTALQIYDDKRDMNSASGPTSNQELCGLHLDYMIHLATKCNTNIVNSTELSIFNIMDTYGIPQRFSSGANVHPGNYRSCIATQLNIVRKELNEVDATGAEKYFKIRTQSKQQEIKSGLKVVVYEFLKTYVGPFIGFLPEPDTTLVEKFQDQIQLQEMRYCLAGLRWPVWPNTSHSRRNLAARTAACLPETCDSSSLKFHYDKIKRLIGFQLNDYYAGYYIENLYCLPDEKSEFRNPFNYNSTKIFIVFAITWLCLTILATLVGEYFKYTRGDARGHKNGQEPMWWMYLSCWCLTRNIRNLCSIKSNQEETKPKSVSMSSGRNDKQGKLDRTRVSLEPLEGLKVISSIAIILAHSCVVNFAASWNVTAAHQMMSRSWTSSISVISPSVVDIFFVITGIIIAKILFQNPRKRLLSVTFWLQFIVYRYIRIVPLYLLIHWFLKSMFRFLGSGPFWDYGTSFTSWSKMCQNESWWSVLLLMANFKSPARHCNGVGWYLANDIQFTLITPFFIVLYLKKPLLAHISILFSILAMVTNHINYYWNLSTSPRGGFEWSLLTLTRVTDDASDGYVNPQYRCVSYLIGLAAGYILHLYGEGVIERWPRHFVIFGKAFVFFITYLTCFTTYITTLLPMQNRELIHFLGGIFGGTIHSVVSLSAAIFVLLLCTGQLPAIAHLFNMKWLRPFANASLSTLLTHIPVIFYHSLKMTRLQELSGYQFATTTIIWCLESYMLSLLVHLVVELPIRKFLTKLMLGISFSRPSNVKEKKN